MGSRTPSERTRLAIGVGIGLSLGLHLMAYAAIPSTARVAPQPTQSELDVAVLPDEPDEPEAAREEPVAPEPPEPEPEPAARPRRAQPPEPVAQRPDRPEPEPDTPPPPAEETPVRFDDVTLTNEGQRSSWATHAGSGQAADGPLAPPGLVTGRRARGEPGGVPGGSGQPRSGPRVVPLGDLSRPPEPPGNDELTSLLSKIFKRSDAWKAGVTGMASVRVRIEPNGTVASVRTLSETVQGHGLGDLCATALRTTRWRPPLDGEGRRVATWVTFKCDFRFR
jgi:hypothetical protein